MNKIESKNLHPKQLKVLLIDNQGGNGPKKIEERLLPGHQVETVKVWELTPDHYDGHDLVVLSGGSRAKANTPEPTFQYELALIKDAVVPVFGICLGMQLIIHAYEGEIKRMEENRLGLLKVTTFDENSLTQGLGELTVYQNHKRAAKSTPKPLQTLGTSEDGIEIIRHIEKPIVGVQFHPERDGDFPTQGRVIFDRFMEQIVYES